MGSRRRAFRSAVSHSVSLRLSVSSCRASAVHAVLLSTLPLPVVQYFIVENAITDEEGAHLRGLLHRTHRELEARGSYTKEMDIREGVFSRNTDLQVDPVVMSLLTQEKVFPKMVDIMGANIYNWHKCVSPPALAAVSVGLGWLTPSACRCPHARRSFTPCTRPAPEGTVMPTLGQMQTSVPRYGWHRDGGFERFFKERPTPRMTAKFVYYLSDMSEPGRGNTWIVPGSHKRGDVTVDVPEVGNIGASEGQPDGAIPVCCPPNSCLLFDRRLLHCGTPNYSTEHERLLFIIGFVRKRRSSLFLSMFGKTKTCYLFLHHAGLPLAARPRWAVRGASNGARHLPGRQAAAWCNLL